MPGVHPSGPTHAGSRCGQVPGQSSLHPGELCSAIMGTENDSFFAAYSTSDPADSGLADDKADLSLAWDAAEQYGVSLLRQALPDARCWPAPVADLSDAAARIRSAIRKWPCKQLARAAWGRGR